jgi:hypothetical protein
MFALSTNKQSRLEMYVAVLKALGETQSLSVGAIEGKTKIDVAFLVQALTFLEQQNLVDSKVVKRDVIYKSTPRGMRVVKFMGGAPQIANDGVATVAPLSEEVDSSR